MRFPQARVPPLTGISSGGWPLAGLSGTRIRWLEHIRWGRLVVGRVVGVSQRDRAAVALRLEGAGFVDIAEVLDFAGPEQARLAVERGLAAEGSDEEDRQRLRLEEERRLMGLLRPLYVKATDDEDPEMIPASRAALAIIDRHSKLMGLDAPTEVVVHNPTTVEIDAWVARVMLEEGNQFAVEADVMGELGQ